MKKILLIIILCLFPLFTYADECTKEQINQYKKEIENIKIDVLQDKNILIDAGDSENTRTKGVFKIKANFIPKDYIISFGDQYLNNNLNSNYLEASGYTGGIYTVIYKNINCQDTIIKKYRLYLPTYTVNSNGNVWNDGTIYTPDSEERITSKTILLLLLLFIMFAILIITIVLIINSKKRKAWKET